MTALLGFSLLVALLGGLALVPARLPRLRLAAIAAAPAAILLVSHAVHAYQGWPVAVAQPPQGALFISAQVDEPHAIYLWLIPRNASQPRAYRVPYTDQAYAQVLQAVQAQKHGQLVTVQKAARHARHTGQVMPRWALRRYRLPPVRPPRKTN